MTAWMMSSWATRRTGEYWPLIGQHSEYWPLMGHLTLTRVLIGQKEAGDDEREGARGGNIQTGGEKGNAQETLRGEQNTGLVKRDPLT